MTFDFFYLIKIINLIVTFSLYLFVSSCQILLHQLCDKSDINRATPHLTRSLIICDYQTFRVRHFARQNNENLKTSGERSLKTVRTLGKKY